MTRLEVLRAERSAADVAWAAAPEGRLAAWVGALRADLAAAAPDELGRVLVGRTEELMADMEPTALGVPRPGRHTGTTWWLHYDGQLMVVAAVMAAGEVVPPHNHGNWNVTGVWRGAVHYTGYHRRDDRSVDLVADLAVAERRVVRAGQAVFCPPPPDDIHEVVSLEEGTLTVLVAPPFADVREYYLPERGCYVRRRGGAEGPGVPAPPADGGAS